MPWMRTCCQSSSEEVADIEPTGPAVTWAQGNARQRRPRQGQRRGTKAAGMRLRLGRRGWALGEARTAW
jgi:hypothetical protein